jgi:hypothetical protein
MLSWSKNRGKESSGEGLAGAAGRPVPVMFLRSLPTPTDAAARGCSRTMHSTLLLPALGSGAGLVPARSGAAGILFSNVLG